MRAEDFLKNINCEFYTGVPDSQLKALCDCLMDIYSIDAHHHVIAANEGNCVGIAAGYNLATGKVPAVYLQNSGEGNIINPVASLLNDKVYAIPCIFIIGWRGEPGVHDEPQHIYQGIITVELLKNMGIKTHILDKTTTVLELKEWVKEWESLFETGKQVALVVRKGALEYDGNIKYCNKNEISREEIIKHIVAVSAEDPIVSTTGKASRELFEIRESNKQGHQNDFLTVGSMGHCSSIALGVAVNKPNMKIWCIDGDGAVLMHMGAMAVIGANHPKNLVHIVINNGAHETVGGMPTVADKLNLVGIAKSCGYNIAVSVNNFKDLDSQLIKAKRAKELVFIEVKASLGARPDLGRPTTTALQNKINFMKYLKDNN